MQVTIKASGRSNILRERTKYVNDYNNRKQQYREQSEKFNSEYSGYVNRVTENVKELFKDNMAALPGLKLEVDKSLHNHAGAYTIVLWYDDPKQKNPERVKSKTGYSQKRGVSWKYFIYLEGTDTYKEDGSHEWVFQLRKEPEFYGQLLDSTDYPTLRATLDLFDKIETIDWEELLYRIYNEVPKYKDYVTVADPGYLNTKPYDHQIDQYDLSRIIGKDIWIKVDIEREQSYDRWSDYSNSPGVDGVGWIKILSQTEKFYTFLWLSDGDKLRDIPVTSFALSRVNRAMQNSHKLKKIYFKVKRPLEYYTTEELKEEIIPEYKSQTDDEES